MTLKLRAFFIFSLVWSLGVQSIQATSVSASNSPTFTFIPEELCAKSLSPDSAGGAFNYLSGTFTAIRQKFKSDEAPKKSKGLLKKVFSVFIKEKPNPEEELKKRLTRELSINAADFLKEYRGIILDLLDAVPSTVESMANKPMSYEDFVNEIQWRLLIGKSLMNGREFYIIYLGELPTDKHLDFNEHSKEMVVLLPNVKSNGGEVFSLRGQTAKKSQFPGVLAIESLVKDLKPKSFEGYSKIFEYSEHYVISNGWLLKQKMKVTVQEGWMPKVLERQVSNEAIRANPYDLSGVLALASNGGSLIEAWNNLGKSDNRKLVLARIDSDQLRDATLALMDSDVETWSVSFGTEILSLAAAYPLEVFQALQFEKFKLLIDDTSARLARVNELRAIGDKKVLADSFYALTAFLRENQGYIEGQLAELVKYKKAGEKLKLQIMPVIEKLLAIHKDYSEKCRGSASDQSVTVENLEEQSLTLRILDSKLQSFHVAVSNIEQSLGQIKTRESEYLEFFRDLEKFIQQFPSMVLNPDSPELVREIETLRQAAEHLK